jgi:hypothetical protein
MLNKVGWIKLHRNLRNSFSNDKKLNIELWMLYVFLAEQAAWDNHDNLKRGQVKIKASEIQKEIFPKMLLKRIRHLIGVLRTLGHIKTVAATHDNKEGLIIEVCQYELFSGELPSKHVGQSLDSASPVLGQSETNNQQESLINNHVNMPALDTPETELEPNWKGDGCSSIIEERNKEEKEKKEELIRGNSSSANEPAKLSNVLSLVKDEPKKLNKKAPMKKDAINPKPVIDAYYEGYRQRYGVPPVINAMAGANAKALINRLGSAEKAVAIVGFYLTHNNRFYLQNAHAFKFCLNDCEKLHTEYMKNDYIFNKDAKKVEDATANSILLDNLLARNRKERDE